MKKERNFDNFDEFADDYRNIHDDAVKLSGANSDYFSEYKIVELKNNEKITESFNILDFGCGDGNSCVYFRKHFPKSIINGIDVSEESINKANKRR